MPVGHYQMFKFSVASEAVLPDNHSCPPLPFPPCVFERVMGTVFACRALPDSVDRALVTLDRIHVYKCVSTGMSFGSRFFDSGGKYTLPFATNRNRLSSMSSRKVS